MSALIDEFVDNLPGNPEVKQQFHQRFSPKNTLYMYPPAQIQLKLEATHEILIQHYLNSPGSKEIAEKWDELNQQIKSTN